MNKLSVLTKGIIKENPVLVLVLGTCPVLATSTGVTSALGMGAATTAVLICSNIVISILKKVIPDKVRIPCYIVVIASFVTLVQMVVKAYAPALNTAHYCYALTTCGDDIGQCMKELQKALHQKGLHADSVFSLVMPESYVCLPGFKTDTAEVVQHKMAKAREDLKGFIELINERCVGKELVFKGTLPFTKTYVLGMTFNKWLITDKPFKVDADLCIHCGKCAKVCPVGNISMQKEPALPSWHHDGTCTNCLACYHVCPKHAVSYWNTRKKGQYYLP